MRSYFLPFALPDLDNTELQEIEESLTNNWITTGPKVKQFEREFSKFIGAKYAVALNSGTAAMHLSLEAVGIGPNDLVMTTPFTFAATAEVVRYFDAIPLFVDVEPDTLNIDINRIEEMLLSIKKGSNNPYTKSLYGNNLSVEKVKSIIPVHIGGHPCYLSQIYQLADEYNLAFVEDAAHALPTLYDGELVGSSKIQEERLKKKEKNVLSTVCFSFYATKPLATGEGGMLVTDDETIAERARIMSLHGISKDAWKRYTAEGSWYYEIIAPGYKYNMTDIAAAMGLAQLRKVNRMWERRVEIAQKYNHAFREYPELEIPTVRKNVQHSWHLYLLRLILDKLTIDRNQFIEELKARNIGTSVHFIPLHIHPYYRATYGYKPEDFPVAYNQYLRVISLPIYSKMTDEDVNDVIEAVGDVVENYNKKELF